MLAPVAVAQCFDPNLGTPLSATTPLFGDVMLPMQAIGFAFPLGGTTYTNIHIADKGYAFFSNSNVPPIPGFVDIDATAAELAAEEPRVCALWSDLQVLAANSGEIWLNATATKCTVTWQNMTCYSATCPPFTMQLQLFVTGEVAVVYGPGATNNSISAVPAWQVGVVGVSPGFTTLGTASDLSAGGFTASNLVYEEWLVANTFDMAGRGLQLIPTNPGWVFTQPVGCASVAAYGDGCVERADSVYEAFAIAFDLGNTTVSWFRTPNGYSMLTTVAGAFVTPSATAINIAPGMLDAEQVVTLSAPMPVPGGTTSAFNITTKGQVEFASTTNGFVDFTPSSGELLDWARTAFHCWHDYDQTDVGSGLILFEEVGGVAYDTWNGVHSFSASVPNTFQFQFDLGSGNVTLVMGAMNGVVNPDAIVVGYSIGGSSFDPGPTDLSALAGVIDLVDTQPIAGLQLGVTGLPTIGSTTFSLDTSNVPNLVPLGFVFFGDTQVNPGIDLTFLGMPGCFGYTNANLGSATFPVSLPAGTGSVPLAIPNNPVFVGAVLTSQSIAFSLVTPLNLISSNGMRIELGN